MAKAIFEQVDSECDLAALGQSPKCRPDAFLPQLIALGRCGEPIRGRDVEVQRRHVDDRMGALGEAEDDDP